jgi:hypothetical protein
MRHIRTILKWLLPSVKIAHQMLAVSAEVFLRHSFGVRYVGYLVAGFFSCCLYTLLIGLTGLGEKIPFLKWYLAAYFVLVSYHIFCFFGRRNSVVHSQSTGVPWNVWSVRARESQIFQLLAEPSFIAITGLIVLPFDAPLAVWLLGCGLCHFIKGATGLWNRWNRLHDALDARLEGERMSEAVREYHAPRSRQDQPSTVVVSHSGETQHNRPMRDIVGNLDPALRRLMSDENLSQERPHHAGPLEHLPRITRRI